MQIVRRFFPEVIQDNESAYFAHLEGIVSSIDELAILEITKSPRSYNFRLAPSVPKYNSLLLEEILKFHNLYNIKLQLSKSIKTSATINFKINLDV